MTLDEALAHPGRLVAAWDQGWPKRAVLDIYETTELGAKRIHREEVPLDKRTELHNKVLARGIRLGRAYSYTNHVWVLDGRGVSVWTDEALLVDGSTMVIDVKSGAVKARDVTKVITFLDPDDIGHRGIRCQLASSVVVFAEEHHEAARTKPFYSADELYEDMDWAVLLGHDLAMWLRVPHVEPTGKVTNTDELEIVKACDKLANIVDRLPQTGDFEHAVEAIGTFGGHGQMQFRYAPNPRDPSSRFLELRLFTPSGNSHWARWIFQGANVQVAAYLRAVRTPREIMVHLDEMARKTAQEGYS